ncbi:MAG TPA: hypothetical protein VFS29_08215 [Motilibacteraceae bacterium]|nr:hypothetical protein [Motilibacteraceae bacterium]
MGDIPEPWPDDPLPPDRPPREAPLPHDPPRLPGQAAVEAPDIRPAVTPPRGDQQGRSRGRQLPDQDALPSDETSDGVPSEPPD